MKPVLAIISILVLNVGLSAAPVSYRITGVFPHITDPSNLAFMKELYTKVKDLKGKKFDLLITTDDTPCQGVPNGVLTENFRKFASGYWSGEGDFMSGSLSYGYGAILYVSGKPLARFESVKLEFRDEGIYVGLDKDYSGATFAIYLEARRGVSYEGLRLLSHSSDQVVSATHECYVFERSDRLDDGIGVGAGPKPSWTIYVTATQPYFSDHPPLDNFTYQLDVLPDAIELPFIVRESEGGPLPF